MISMCIKVHNKNLIYTSTIIVYNVHNPYQKVKLPHQNTTNKIHQSIQQQIPEIISIEHSEINKKIVIFVHNKDRKVISQIQQLNHQYKSLNSHYQPFQTHTTYTRSIRSSSQNTRQTYAAALINYNKNITKEAFAKITNTKIANNHIQKKIQ